MPTTTTASRQRLEAAEADLPEIRDLYSWATITEVDERRAIGSGRAPCLVISANEGLIDNV